jgi:hypothetical protein
MIKRFLGKTKLSDFKDPFKTGSIVRITISIRNLEHKANWAYRDDCSGNVHFEAYVHFKNNNAEGHHRIEADSLQLLHSKIETFVKHIDAKT